MERRLIGMSVPRFRVVSTRMAGVAGGYANAGSEKACAPDRTMAAMRSLKR
jgi:hypothetical protein